MGKNNPEALCTTIDQYTIVVFIKPFLRQFVLPKLGCHLNLTSPPGTECN